MGVRGCLLLWKHSSDCSAQLSRLPWLRKRKRERQTPFILIKAKFTLLFHLPVLLHKLTIKLYGTPRATRMHDRTCPSSALQDCAWLLCRVNQSQPWILSGVPSHCSGSYLLAAPLFIFHSFEKHSLSTFYVPSSGLGADSNPGTLLHAPGSTYTPVSRTWPWPISLQQQGTPCGPFPLPTLNVYSVSLLLQCRGISNRTKQLLTRNNSLNSFTSGISSGSHSTPVQILPHLQDSVQTPPSPGSLPWSHLSLGPFGVSVAPVHGSYHKF